jgi:hypothetical protein
MPKDASQPSYTTHVVKELEPATINMPAGTTALLPENPAVMAAALTDERMGGVIFISDPANPMSDAQLAHMTLTTLLRVVGRDAFAAMLTMIVIESQREQQANAGAQQGAHLN